MNGQWLNCEKEVAERWKRGAEGAETNAEGVRIEAPRGGEWGEVSLPNRLGVCGSVVSSPSGVRAPAENEFVAFCGR